MPAIFHAACDIGDGSGPPYAAIVVDANTGAVLHAANPDELRHPASLTKIMTLYLLFERLEAGKLRLDTALDGFRACLRAVAHQARPQARPERSRSKTRSAGWSRDPPTTPPW